jgi:hypothetical protein
VCFALDAIPLNLVEKIAARQGFKIGLDGRDAGGAAV